MGESNFDADDTDEDLLTDIRDLSYAHGYQLIDPNGSREGANRSAKDSLDACAEVMRRLTALHAENARLRAALLRLADDDSDEAYAARAALDAKEVDGG